MTNFLSNVIIWIITIEIIITLSIFFINIYLTYTNNIKEKRSLQKQSIHFSIHIPTRAEPFEVVKSCIDSIFPQLVEGDEMIILDNNHSNKADYLPLQNYCEKLNITFEHHDYIPGYKAGALNRALSITAPSTTNVLIVDCDYVIKPNGLNEIREMAASNPEVGFIQFPQAYLENNMEDVENELNKYFLYNLEINKFKSLGTGTLCCIKYDSLQKIKGWPTNSITEDAQFGLEIQKIGETGLYVSKIIGRGYLPKTINDFYTQRKRWIYGNAEVLVNMLKNQSNCLKLSNISQLSTWLNFSAFTITLHFILLILALFNVEVSQVLNVVYVHYIIIFLTKFYEFLHLPIPLYKRIRAFMIQWQFNVISSFHWLPVLFNKSKEFIRTPKLNVLNSSILNIPFTFLLLNVFTIVIMGSTPMLIGFSIFFILLELLCIKVLITNYKL